VDAANSGAIGRNGTARLLARFGVAYAALVLFVLFGLPAISPDVLGPMVSYVWLLGPPVNLVHGWNYSPAFAIGTALIVGPAIGLARASRLGWRIFWSVVLALLWALSGVMVYAPSA
jgi:hypothetical protein